MNDDTKAILLGAFVIGLFLGVIFVLPVVLSWQNSLNTQSTGVLATYFDQPIQNLNVRITRQNYAGGVLNIAEGPTNSEGYFLFQGKTALTYTVSLIWQGTAYSKQLPGGAIWNFTAPIVLPSC